jgi:zinc protease
MAEDSIVDGSWDVSASFAPALLEKGIASTRREVERWWRDGVTDDELAARKQGLVGSYRVSLSTTGGLASAILTDILRGYGVSRLDEFPDAVNALTRVEINASIKKHIIPSRMVLIKAGSVVPGIR